LSRHQHRSADPRRRAAGLRRDRRQDSPRRGRACRRSVKHIVERRGLTIQASIGKHLAFAPVAFAVTEGPAHVVVYANRAFRVLQSAGEIGIAPDETIGPSTADLAPLLDQVFESSLVARDSIVRSRDADTGSWSCTVWP